ncbi:MAG: helix-hairpin-helix domain-containing protein [Pseudomonadota bacterium]
MIRNRIIPLCIVVAVMMALVSVSLAQEAEKININKASSVELTQLKRIGPKLSERIVEYREKHGPFERPEDIMQVKGIGPKTFELNKDRITTE